MASPKAEKTIKTTVAAFSEFHTEGFRKPSKFFIRTFAGDYLFIHVRTRKEAQEWANEFFGKGKYIVRAEGAEGGNSTGARCAMNSASRKGSSFLKMKNNYGAGE